MKIDKTQIEVFLRQKVEDETLSDAQIARLLHVGTSTVRYWRERYHIKPAQKFQRKFRDKYGPDALERFDHMVRTRATLQAIAAHFGFTREYARQVYKKLYHASYRKGPVRRHHAIDTTIYGMFPAAEPETAIPSPYSHVTHAGSPRRLPIEGKPMRLPRQTLQATLRTALEEEDVPHTALALHPTTARRCGATQEAAIGAAPPRRRTPVGRA